VGKRWRISLTTDRLFHNKILSEGLTSYYANQGAFSSRKLKGVKPKDDFIQNKYDSNIKTGYLPPQADIRPCVMPSSEIRLKNSGQKEEESGTILME
jgi:hypothetical protein